MRLIDADELKDQLIQNLNELTKGEESDRLWLIVYSIIAIFTDSLDKVHTITKHYDCNHDCDALYEAYDRGFSKGYLEGGADAYCKSDCDALHEAYDRGYSKGFSEGREEEKKEVMMLTDHCIGKCDILENVLNMEGVKDD